MAIGTADFIKALLGELNILRFRGFGKCQCARTARIEDFNGGAGRLTAGSQVEKRAHGEVGGTVIEPREIVCRFVHKRHEAGVQGEVVRYVIERGSEHEDTSLAHLLFEE